MFKPSASAAAHALLLGGLGAWLTFAFTNPLGHEWSAKDYVFVLAVVAAVYYNRTKTMKYETLMQEQHFQKRQTTHALSRVEWVHGPAVQIELNKVTVLLFFGTWDAKSRAALQRFERLRKSITHQAVQFVALTQEKREELEAYEVKGRHASDFQELKQFSFSIAIEDGLMCKNYIVRFDLSSLPQLFIIGKDKTIAWYGSPSDTGIEETIRECIMADNVSSERPLPPASTECKKDK
ncbi:hypothetical protein P43SY_005272 [Pythium insidiosum]|uniref:Thioredoxin domain-containing protein n=1 Tax=Pythium insidiosum TaxID=114742 RepID=A0AAD5LFV0_PYTIN|nr:hypothetical protein P43SY_005272 [Pythium insidiosum]